MSFQEAINQILPPVQNSNGTFVNPHITISNNSPNDYGYRPKKGGGEEYHNGVDVNYEGGQTNPLNQNTPAIYCPVDGTVVIADKKTGTVMIRDADGNLHTFYHLNDVNTDVLVPGEPYKSSDPIGTMGGRGDRNRDGVYGPNEYDRHVHYEVKDSAGNFINPETHWENRSPDSISNPDPSNNWPDASDIIGGSMFGGLNPDDLRDLFGDASTTKSPLVFDLDGDGMETTSLSYGVFFDHDANGFAELTGWVGPDDGLLVMDRNGNGIIDNGTELFGNHTILSNGKKAANGFAALAELDDNKDGIIDASDAAYSQLKIWRDMDGDGWVTYDEGENGQVITNELFTLSELGIQSIDTGYTNTNITDANGNIIKQTGTFTWADGTTGAAADVWLQTDNMYTIANEWLDVPDDIAALPNLSGYGNVYDLHQAMARDESGKLSDFWRGRENLLSFRFAAVSSVLAQNGFVS